MYMLYHILRVCSARNTLLVRYTKKKSHFGDYLGRQTIANLNMIIQIYLKMILPFC